MDRNPLVATRELLPCPRSNDSGWT